MRKPYHIILDSDERAVLEAARKRLNLPSVAHVIREWIRTAKAWAE